MLQRKTIACSVLLARRGMGQTITGIPAAAADGLIRDSFRPMETAKSRCNDAKSNIARSRSLAVRPGPVFSPMQIYRGLTGTAGTAGGGSHAVEGGAEGSKEETPNLHTEVISEMTEEEMEEEERKWLDGPQGTPAEKAEQRFQLCRETIEKGEVIAGLNMIEKMIRRGYQEANLRDTDVREILAEAHFIACTIRQQLGHWEAGLQHMEHAINFCEKAANKNPLIWYAAGSCSAVLGNLEKTLKYYEMCKKIATKEDYDELPWLKFKLPFNTGTTQLRAGMFGEALECFAEALKAVENEGNAPKSCEAAVFYFVARCRSAKGDHTAACATWDEFEKQQQHVDETMLEQNWKVQFLKHSARSQMIMACSHDQQSDARRSAVDKACAQTQELTEMAPKSAQAWWMRADCLQMLGDYKAALESYQRVLECEDNNSSSPSVHLQIAQCLLALERASEAEDMFRAAVKIAPNYPQALAGLARALCEKGQDGLTEAEGLLKTAMEGLKGKTTAEFMAVRSECTALSAVCEGIKGGSVEVRRKLLRSALDMDPKNATARSLLESLGQ